MSIEHYRKLPIEVATCLWTGDNLDELISFTGHKFHLADNSNTGDPDITAEVFDELHSTWVGVKTGQRVVRGVRGEFYPIDQSVLNESYESVSPPGAEV